ncbi:GNAT family N-acetyltransferase [Paratissierella segnis]|uniref:DUF3440 domain-containing protein n=1 Tax=Paratissierella segnis TaxID=2763679 RepID=A0A926IKA1_9FIRM|nr:GNAT family N-acetyltransferase [Paratissierella segnis]MBC8588075.1 DUF3440 domain-containing protein [Paratissierella segnis]
MAKIYNDKNVLDAAIERYEIVFNAFDNIYFSVSGGKDSSVMLQLAAMVARKMNKKFDVLYIDLEAQYKATIEHVEELIVETKDVVGRFYWCALPLSLRNAVSVIQPKWICWDKNDKHKWVREMPKNKHVINEDNCPWNWFRRGMEFEEFIVDFAVWYQEQHNSIVGAGIGIRSDESLNRFRTIISDKKVRYKNYGWTTQLKISQDKWVDVYNFFPIYDWRVEDIWGSVSKLDLKFNEIYELMYKNGLSIYEQRLCQPYGDDQRNGLDQFKALEYETWEKVLNRVHGVNFGNIYARTSLLGNIKSEKPDGMTWEQYTVWLLESLRLYAPELEDHYYRKIKTFMSWWEKEADITPKNMPDDKWEIEGYRQSPYWKRIARAIEKNDFWMSRLSFGQTKSDVERLFELKKKYKNLIYGADTDSTPLKRIAAQLNKEDEDVLKVKVYKGSYDKSEFYSIMGRYFAEREFRKELQYIINDESMEWYLFYEGDELAGFSSVSIEKNKVMFGNMYVLESFRNKGVWSFIADYLVKEYKSSTIQVLTNIDKLISAWGERGFEVTGNRGSYSVMRRKNK